MAANRASTIEEWENFFEELLRLMTDYEAFYDSTDLRLRENIVIRMESALLALQQVITLAIERRMDCASVLQEIFNNVRILFLELTRRRETQTGSPCSNLAIYSLEMPTVERRGRPGRPRFEISEDVLLELRSYGFTWKQVADMLLVSRWTLRRRVVEYGLQETTGFTALSDEQIDFYVKQFIEEHGNLVGCSMVQGFLKSLGFRLQRRRVRASISRVDPHNSRIRWAIVVSRRAYSVQGPNSLWHIDGHHSLVNWGFVIHGGIDGFSRLIVYLHCSNTNRKETVTHLFRSATERYDWPSRVRTDHGGENVGVWQLMEEVRGLNRGSFLAGASVHNQRIERLWRDVFCSVCHTFYYTFQAMEESGLLQRNNSLHKFVLHYIFIPRINKALQSFAAAWNHHPMRTERHWSPFQMWTNGVLDMRNHSLVGISDIAESGGDVDDLQWYGYDPFAPTPSDDGLSTVEVEDVNNDLPTDTLTLLRQNIDPLQHSDSFGIDLFQNGLLLLMQAGE